MDWWEEAWSCGDPCEAVIRIWVRDDDEPGWQVQGWIEIDGFEKFLGLVLRKIKERFNLDVRMKLITITILLSSVDKGDKIC